MPFYPYLLYVNNLTINDFSNLRFNIFPGESEVAKLHGVPAPFRRRFPARPVRVIAGYSMQTVM